MTGKRIKTENENDELGSYGSVQPGAIPWGLGSLWDTSRPPSPPKKIKKPGFWGLGVKRVYSPISPYLPFKGLRQQFNNPRHRLILHTPSLGPRALVENNVFDLCDFYCCKSPWTHPNGSGVNFCSGLVSTLHHILYSTWRLFPEGHGAAHEFLSAMVPSIDFFNPLDY
mgnify:CR=1 FL=1